MRREIVPQKLGSGNRSLSYLPDPNKAFVNKDKTEPQGVFKALQDRGIKITDYTETDGAGHVIKKSRWS
jgi:hypothetical protein